LTAELERYKNQVGILKEQNNVDKASESCARSLEIDNLKHTLSKHLKEKESLEQMITLLKNDFQKEESKNIDRELALEKQVKELKNIIFKRNQSTYTIYMLTKPQFFYDHYIRQALGFQNPCYLKKAQQLEPKLYDGSVIQKTDAIVIRDSAKTLMLEDESRSKMLQKQKDPMMLEKKVNIKLNYRNSKEPNLSTNTTTVKVPKELPKVSMSLEIEKLKHTLFEHLKEKESLEQKVTLLTHDLQKEESRNINRELALEKQETLLLVEESRSKMLQKQNEPIMSEKKVITKPVDYVALNQLSKDFETRFVPQAELSAEQAFWSRYLVLSEEPNLSSSTTIVEVPKELPKVSMVNFQA
nr:hypothetical protein [Tanacetum cinerariifolium]